jgi:hypothetical protein
VIEIYVTCSREGDISALDSFLGAEIHGMANIYQNEIEVFFLICDSGLKT